MFICKRQIDALFVVFMKVYDDLLNYSILDTLWSPKPNFNFKLSEILDDMMAPIMIQASSH